MRDIRPKTPRPENGNALLARLSPKLKKNSPLAHTLRYTIYPSSRALLFAACHARRKLIIVGFAAAFQDDL